MANFYCTIIDKNYVLRGLTLYNSFLPHIDNKIFGFFCIDQDAVKMLSEHNLKNAWIVGPDEFETPELLAVKGSRAINEYCWTCKPAVLLYAAQRDPSLDWLVYLDSDMMGFADPDGGLPDVPDTNVCLTMHNPCTKYYTDMISTVGKCNAGYAAFKNNKVGLAAAKWWLDRCLELCPKTPTEDAYADQKYLDFVGDYFEGVHYSTLSGLNAGPWNTLTADVSIQGDKVYIGGAPLMLYHFQGFKMYNAFIFDLYTASRKLPSDLKDHIFVPYMKEMKGTLSQIHSYYDSKTVHFDRFPFGVRRFLSEIKRYINGKSNFARC